MNEHSRVGYTMRLNNNNNNKLEQSIFQPPKTKYHFKSHVTADTAVNQLQNLHIITLKT